eukprot:380806_1
MSEPDRGRKSLRSIEHFDMKRNLSKYSNILIVDDRGPRTWVKYDIIKPKGVNIVMLKAKEFDSFYDALIADNINFFDLLRNAKKERNSDEWLKNGLLTFINAMNEDKLLK